MGCIHDQVEKLMSTLNGLAGEPVPLKEHIFSLAAGIIGMLGFGDMYNSDKFPHHKNLQHVLEEAIHVQASFSAEDYFPNIVGRLVDQITGLAARRERIFKQLDTLFECWKHALEAIIKWSLLYFLVHDNCLLFML